MVGELPHVLSNISPLTPPPSLKKQIMQAALLDTQTQEQAHAIQQTFARRRRACSARGTTRALAAEPAPLDVCTGKFNDIDRAPARSFLHVQRPNAASPIAEQLALQQLGSLQANQQQAFALTASTTKQEIVLNTTDIDSHAYGKVTLEPNKPTVLLPRRICRNPVWMSAIFCGRSTGAAFSSSVNSRRITMALL